jgi:hypothetical protein
MNLILLGLFNLAVFTLWCIYTLLYSEINTDHFKITKYCCIILISIHFSDFSNQRFTIYRFLGVTPLTYLLSTYIYHYLFFINACILEFILMYANPT